MAGNDGQFPPDEAAPRWPVCGSCGMAHPSTHSTYLVALGKLGTTDEVRAFEFDVRTVCTLLVALDVLRLDTTDVSLIGAIEEAEDRIRRGLETDPL